MVPSPSNKTSESKGDRGDLRLARAEGRFWLRQQLLSQKCDEAAIRRHVHTLNETVQNLEYNDVVEHVRNLLRGKFWASYLRRLREVVGREDLSSSEETEIPSGSGR